MFVGVVCVCFVCWLVSSIFLSNTLLSFLTVWCSFLKIDDVLYGKRYAHAHAILGVRLSKCTRNMHKICTRQKC